MTIKNTFFYYIAIYFCIISCTKTEETDIDFDALVSIKTTEIIIQESNASVNFNISLNKTNDSGSAIGINYTVSGTTFPNEDYANPSGIVSIASGSIDADLSIQLIDDTMEEENETLIVTLNTTQVSGISVSTLNNASVSIIDNDVNEGEDNCANNNSLSFTNAGCDQAARTDGIYIETVANGIRTIKSNTIPNHAYRATTNNHTMEGLDYSFTMMEAPTKANSVTSVIHENGRPARYYGVALNGVVLVPAPAAPFIFENTSNGEYNWDWVFEPTNNQGTEIGQVKLDCSSAHIGPQGYHYHGKMYGFVETIQAGLSTTLIPAAPVQIGWASDGFPIIYIYGPSSTGELKKLIPSYQIKNGDRPGDGISAPCGAYNGKYTNDYEFIEGSGDLDECNGIERNITLTTAQGSETFSYFYVVTDTFPQISRCLVGTPDPSFEN